MREILRAVRLNYIEILLESHSVAANFKMGHCLKYLSAFTFSHLIFSQNRLSKGLMSCLKREARNCSSQTFQILITSLKVCLSPTLYPDRKFRYLYVFISKARHFLHHIAVKQKHTYIDFKTVNFVENVRFLIRGRSSAVALKNTSLTAGLRKTIEGLKSAEKRRGGNAVLGRRGCYHY